MITTCEQPLSLKLSLLSILIFSVVGCAQIPFLDKRNVTCVDQDIVDETTSKQIESLINVYYGSKTSEKSQTYVKEMTCMSETTLARARTRLRFAKPKDRQKLDELFPNSFLQLIALRDTDNDGYLDFRIKDYDGVLFMENDTDADGDGIWNAFDLRPTNADAKRDAPGNKDNDDDGIPDHLDWSNQADLQKSEELSDLQRRLFDRYGVLLHERDQEFTDAVRDILEDVFKVFSNQFDKYQLNKTLRIISTAKFYAIEESDIAAEVSPANGRAIFYKRGFDGIDDPDSGARLKAFLLVVHELMHNVQYAMDYETNQHHLLTNNVLREPYRFVSLLNTLGWDVSMDRLKPQLNNYDAFVYHEEEFFAPVEYFQGLEIGELHKAYRIEEVRKDYEDVKTLHEIYEVGELHYYDYKEEQLREAWKLTETGTIGDKYNVVNDYSLDDAKEWHAEQVTATVLSEMLKRTELEHGSVFVACAQKKVNDLYDPIYYYRIDQMRENTAMVKVVLKELGLSDEDYNYLSDKYINKVFKECNS